jgi:hypothetical protein
MGLQAVVSLQPDAPREAKFRGTCERGSNPSSGMTAKDALPLGLVQHRHLEATSPAPEHHRLCFDPFSEFHGVDVAVDEWHHGAEILGDTALDCFQHSGLGVLIFPREPHRAVPRLTEFGGSHKLSRRWLPRFGQLVPRAPKNAGGLGTAQISGSICGPTSSRCLTGSRQSPTLKSIRSDPERSQAWPVKPPS